MSDYRKQANDAVAEAFGHARSTDSHSVEEFDRQLARTFGREADADVRLREELVEAGLTESGARGALLWLDDFGSDIDAAVRSGAGFNGVQPGRVDSLVHERAEVVLRRHRGPRTGSGSVDEARESRLDPSSGNLPALRSELVEAHRKRNESHYPDPAVGKRMAEIAANSAIESFQEWGVRDGWSREQFETRLEECIAQTRGNSQRPSRALRAAAATEAPQAQVPPSAVSEAEFDAAFTTDKTIAEAFGRQIKES